MLPGQHFPWRINKWSRSACVCVSCEILRFPDSSPLWRRLARTRINMFPLRDAGKKKKHFQRKWQWHLNFSDRRQIWQMLHHICIRPRGFGCTPPASHSSLPPTSALRTLEIEINHKQELATDTTKKKKHSGFSAWLLGVIWYEKWPPVHLWLHLNKM